MLLFVLDTRTALANVASRNIPPAAVEDFGEGYRYSACLMATANTCSTAMANNSSLESWHQSPWLPQRPAVAVEETKLEERELEETKLVGLRGKRTLAAFQRHW